MGRHRGEGQSSSRRLIGKDLMGRGTLIRCPACGEHVTPGEMSVSVHVRTRHADEDVAERRLILAGLGLRFTGERK